MKNKLSAVFFFLLAGHIVLSLCFSFKISLPLFDGITLLRYYKSYAVLGPFFTDQSVRSSYLSAVSFKRHKWSNWYFPQLDSHDDYLNHADYEQLKRAEFEKLLSWYALSIKEKPELKQFLFRYLMDDYSKSNSLDSIRILVMKRQGLRHNILTDTLLIQAFSIQ